MTGTGISPPGNGFRDTDAVSEARAYELKKRREVRAMMREPAVHDVGVSNGFYIWGYPHLTFRSSSVSAKKGLLDRSRLRALAVLRQDERKAVVQEKLYQQWRAGGMGWRRWVEHGDHQFVVPKNQNQQRPPPISTSASRNLDVRH